MTQLNQKIKDVTIPDRMRHLPIDDRGFPVPKFVPWIDGKPEFRGMNPDHLRRCVMFKFCWLCGERMGRHMTFVIGPMCIVNRISSEPPCHHECATYAAKTCPFLTQPRMRRNEKDMPEGSVAGIAIKRNPGVTALWTTKSYKTIKANGTLFQIGPLERVEFYAEGRYAMRAEVAESIATGLPILQDMARQDGPEAVAQLASMTKAALALVPVQADDW